VLISGGRMKKLIVSADDFGWSRGVNRGIVDAHLYGVLTSAALLVNFPAHADAARRARGCPALGVGLHLNIVHGSPLADPARIPSLLGTKGRFPGPFATLRRLLSGRIRRRELDLEIKAQLERFRETAGEPTHLDSHKHMHAFGCFTEAVAALAGEMSVPRVRCPLPLFPGWSWKSRLLRPAGRRAAASFEKAGIRFPDGLVGEDGMASRGAAELCRMLERIPEGVTELMCHPGYGSPDEDDVVPGVAVKATRESDLAALQDEALRTFLESQRIELIHYGQL